MKSLAHVMYNFTCLYITNFLGCALHGMDHYGDDLKRVSADDYMECGHKCLDHPSCKRWTFKPFSAFPESSDRGQESCKKVKNFCTFRLKSSKSGSNCKMNGNYLAMAR